MKKLILCLLLGVAATTGYAKKSIDALGGEWNVIEFNGQADNDKGRFVAFNLTEHRLYGSTGCNALFAQILTATTGGKLAFGPMAATRKHCPDVEGENAFVRGLQGVTGYKFDKKSGTLNLVSGKTTMAKLTRKP